MKKLWPVFAAVVAGLAIWAGCVTAQSNPPPTGGAATGLRPGPNDPRIAYVTARLLEDFHYLQRPLDREMSERFFDNYVDALDPRHENLLQSDLAEFESYRTNLDTLTIGGHGTADLTPAFAIYQRYALRFQEHAAYATDLLHQDRFKFNTDDRFELDRRHEPFPQDLAAARQLWRERLRFEFLQEKLTREIIETNGSFIVRLPADAATNITAMLARHYRWTLRSTTNADSDYVLQVYLNALAHAYDPHSDYFSSPHAQDFSINMNLSLFGIGASLSEDDGFCTIKELVAGGPAAKSKMLDKDDRIVAVAQGAQAPVDVVDMDLEKVVQLIRGAKNTEVRLTISPAEDRTKRRVVTLVRDEIKLEDQQAKAQLIVQPDGERLGIIDLPSFYAPVSLTPGSHSTPRYTSVDVTKLVKKLKEEKVSGIIIDLRSNPGGSLEEAIKFTGLFIKDGPVVQARNPDGQVTVDADTDPGLLYDGPLAVMINRFSASASEIAAAALQDYGRAIIVGDISTHGKGTVQNLNLLKPFVWPASASATNDPGTIKVTIRKFYRVSGASTQLKGVVPDIILPDVLNFSSYVGETSLEHPLPWDTIQPASYNKLNLVQPYLEQLRARSEARIATNQDFAYIRQDIEQFQKSHPEQSATLNEHDAIKERERLATLNHDRDHERNSRPPSGTKVYELTVADADQSGLPPPLETTNEMSTANSAVPTGHAAVRKSGPGLDPALEETERILEDYISILPKGVILMADH